MPRKENQNQQTDVSTLYLVLGAKTVFVPAKDGKYNKYV